MNPPLWFFCFASLSLVFQRFSDGFVSLFLFLSNALLRSNVSSRRPLAEELEQQSWLIFNYPGLKSTNCYIFAIKLLGKHINFPVPGKKSANWRSPSLVNRKKKSLWCLCCVLFFHKIFMFVLWTIFFLNNIFGVRSFETTSRRNQVFLQTP